MAEQPHDPDHARGAAGERGCEIQSTLGKSPALALIIEATPSGHPGLDNNRRPLRRQVLKRPDIRAMPRIGPRTTNRTVCVTLAVQRDGPARAFALYKRDFLLRRGGAGAHNADFAILSDAVSQPHMQHCPNSTESE